MKSSLPRRLSAACLVAGLALSSTASVLAQEIPAPTTAREASRIAIVAEAGTTGFGPALVITANSKLTFTVGYTWLDYDYDVESDDADYAGKLKLSNLKALANWHPWGGTFHFSGGFFMSDNKVDLTAKLKPGNTYEINGVTYTTAEISSLSGSATFEDDIAPYIGVGWAKSPANSGLAFYANLGVFFSGSASAKLSATGSQANNPTVQNNLRAEENDINDDLDALALYPVAQFGIMYRF